MSDWLYHFRYIFNHGSVLFDAGLLTLEASILGAFLAIVWGLVLTVPRMSNFLPVRFAAIAYIDVMRNTPLLVQIYLLYFGLPHLGILVSALACGAIALMMQHGSFLAEVFRGAIQSVPNGQWQAGQSIGLKNRQILARIVLPQAFSKVISPIGNQMILLAKDTSLLAGVGLAELTLTGKMLTERSGAAIWVFIVIGLCYLVLTTLIGILARVCEHIFVSKAKE